MLYNTVYMALNTKTLWNVNDLLKLYLCDRMLPVNGGC